MKIYKGKESKAVKYDVLEKINEMFEGPKKERERLFRLERIGKVILWTGYVVIICFMLFMGDKFYEELKPISGFLKNYLLYSSILFSLAILFGWFWSLQKLFRWIQKRQNININDRELDLF